MSEEMTQAMRADFDAWLWARTSALPESFRSGRVVVLPKSSSTDIEACRPAVRFAPGQASAMRAILTQHKAKLAPRWLCAEGSFRRGFCACPTPITHKHAEMVSRHGSCTYTCTQTISCFGSTQSFSDAGLAGAAHVCPVCPWLVHRPMPGGNSSGATIWVLLDDRCKEQLMDMTKVIWHRRIRILNHHRHCRTHQNLVCSL